MPIPLCLINTKTILNDMMQYNMQLTKDKESQWGFRLDMTVSELELVEKIMALVFIMMLIGVRFPTLTYI